MATLKLSPLQLTEARAALATVPDNPATSKGCATIHFILDSLDPKSYMRTKPKLPPYRREAHKPQGKRTGFALDWRGTGHGGVVTVEIAAKALRISPHTLSAYIHRAPSKSVQRTSYNPAMGGAEDILTVTLVKLDSGIDLANAKTVPTKDKT